MVAVEQPRRMRRGPQGSVGAGGHGGSNSGGGGIHRRMNAIKGGHNQTNHSGHHGGTYRLPNTPHDKMGKQIISIHTMGFFKCSAITNSTNQGNVSGKNSRINYGPNYLLY